MRAHLVVIGLLLAACGREGLSSSSPVIEVVPLALDFGPVPTGLEVSLPVQVRNLGKGTLELNAARVDGAFFSGNTAGVSIPGGERVDVDLAFKPTTEGSFTGVVHLLNNSSNDTDVAIAVSGLGTPRTVCTECNAPPDAYCASTTTLISYERMGSCVGGRCEYQARTTICGGTCATRACTSVATADAGADAGAPMDAGVDAGQVDAGQVDAGQVDAGQVDAGTPLADAGTLQRFDTPGSTVWQVPAGVTSVTVKAWGGGGAGGVQQMSFGGGGAFARGTFAVTPGELLEVEIAEGGVAPGNGAGASALLRGATVVLVAAGGGGGGSDGNSGLTANAGGRGGAGGAQQGQAGQNLMAMIAPYCTGATGGQGGTQSAGGLGGVSTGSATTKCNGQPGGPLTGGRATGVNNQCDTGVGADRWRQGGGQGNGGGGGGGAGYFGGGGAGFIWTYCAGGGGGGSSFVGAVASAAQVVAGTDRTAGNTAEAAGAGAGGLDAVGSLSNGNGAAGRVVITW